MFYRYSRRCDEVFDYRSSDRVEKVASFRRDGEFSDSGPSQIRTGTPTARVISRNATTVLGFLTENNHALKERREIEERTSTLRKAVELKDSRKGRGQHSDEETDEDCVTDSDAQDGHAEEGTKTNEAYRNNREILA